MQVPTGFASGETSGKVISRQQLIVRQITALQNRWSSTEPESNPQHAWNVRWSDGNTNNNNKTNQNLVSCVR